MRLKGEQIQYDDIVEYLGVYLDKGLYWRDHVGLKIKKAKKTADVNSQSCQRHLGTQPTHYCILLQMLHCTTPYLGLHGLGENL